MTISACCCSTSERCERSCGPRPRPARLRETKKEALPSPRLAPLCLACPLRPPPSPVPLGALLPWVLQPARASGLWILLPADVPRVQLEFQECGTLPGLFETALPPVLHVAVAANAARPQKHLVDALLLKVCPGLPGLGIPFHGKAHILPWSLVVPKAGLPDDAGPLGLPDYRLPFGPQGRDLAPFRDCASPKAIVVAMVVILTLGCRSFFL